LLFVVCKNKRKNYTIMFRKQVLENQFDKIWGEVNIVQPVKFKFLAVLISFIVFTVIVFLFSSDYHKKQHVQGYLSPSTGVVKSYSPNLVYVKEVLVKEGDIVKIDQPIVRLKYRNNLSSGLDTQQSLKEQLQIQLILLSEQESKLHEVYLTNKQEKEQKILELDEQIRLYALQQQQVSIRIKILSTRLEEYQPMLNKGFISKVEFEKVKEDLLILQQNLARLQAQSSTSIQQQSTLKIALKRLPLELEKSLNDNKLRVSEKDSRLTELLAESEILITASKAGHITALDIKDGQLLKPQQYMYSILPNDMELYAELLLPTRAFGFVEVGQTTRIKIDSFPYQKFGIVKGEIFETTEFVLFANEAKLPIEIKESVYKVKAKLDKQTILAYGKNISLQAGMKLNADILVDKRSLMEWLFEPLLSLKE